MADQIQIPESIQKFMLAAASGKLSSKDRRDLNKMRSGVKMSPEEEAADMVDNLSDMNMQALSEAIDSAKSPETKQILTDHQDRLQSVLKQIRSAATQASTLTSTPTQVDTPTLMDQLGSFISNLWSSK